MNELPTSHWTRGWGCIGVLIALFAIFSLLNLVPEIGQHQASLNASSKNNLKQCGLAFHNYLSANGAFPARAICDANGKPLLSWRVAILPYLENSYGVDGEGARLYDQFHLDEPWDSEHNRKLIENMPAVFRNPNHRGDDNVTSYLAVDGAQGIFGGATGATVSDIADRLPNTIMVVEADRSVPWTKPEDLNYDPADSLKDLGKLRSGGFNALLGDGSAKFILNYQHAKNLKGLMTKDGGEDVSVP